MKELEVGDFVCYKKQHSFSDNTTFKFHRVVRITRTRALLDNNEMLYRIPKHTISGLGYTEVGNPYSRWVIATPELAQEAKAERERHTIDKWIKDGINQLSFEQKKEIYLKYKV